MNSERTESDPVRIVICTTGGTISASTSPGGVVNADGRGMDLVTTLATHLPSEVQLEVRSEL